MRLFPGSGFRGAQRRLGVRAHLNERAGDIDEAQNNLLTARSLSGSSYRRSVHELGLGSLFERQDLNDEAHSWYRAALNTCLLDNETSGGSALKGLLRLLPLGEIFPRRILPFAGKLSNTHGESSGYLECRISRTWNGQPLSLWKGKASRYRRNRPRSGGSRTPAFNLYDAKLPNAGSGQAGAKRAPKNSSK